MARISSIATVGCFFRSKMNGTRAHSELVGEMPEAAKLRKTGGEQQMESS
jgi:hypothetical protein